MLRMIKGSGKAKDVRENFWNTVSVLDVEVK